MKPLKSEKVIARTDSILESAMRECESFLTECKAYNARINEFYWSMGVDSHKYYDNASIERGTLKARALLLTRKLQDWRKKGKVE